MESRAPGLTPQICDLNLPNCPVGLEQLFVGRLSVCAEKRLFEAPGSGLAGRQTALLTGVLPPGEACAVLSGDAKGSASWTASLGILRE